MTDRLPELSDTLRPKVAAILEDLVGHGWEPFIAEGRRTVAEQREKVEHGYSATMNSRHLTGDAADIVDHRYLWSALCPRLYWLHLGSSAMAHGLNWGGLFGLKKGERDKLVTAIKKRDFTAAARLKVGWDVGHVEVPR